RLELLQQAIAAEFDTSEVHAVGSDAGLHLALRLPPQCDDRAIAKEAQERGIAVRPLSNYYHDAGNAAPGLVLGYACVEESRIAPAFAVLAGVIKRHL
ncbi:MAG: PLP-dependent aminotransferase family protein, partial [Undibacterium sp.]|nr:PLP-dependent aminotransferase family protein [Undibacterium sp.]